MDRPLALVVLLLGAALAVWVRCHRRRPWHSGAPGVPRTWRPRTPRDCAICRAEMAPPARVTSARPPVQPWRASQSRRGAPKRSVTQGYACPSPTCAYYGNTDAAVHALVGYGHHGSTDHIPDFRCQACGTKVSGRRHTALYRLKTPPERIAQVLSALAEGLDVHAAGRVFGHEERTIRRWLGRAGHHASQMHRHFFHDLHLPHVQMDEIRTRLRARGSVLWLWLVCDPLTKLVPVLALGPRTQQMAHAVVHALRTELAPTCAPIVTTDGLRHYYYALTAHFGHWVQSGRRHRWQVAATLLYGQVHKGYRRRRLVRIRYRVLCGTRRGLRRALQALGLSGRLTTAFVERLNLTVRQSVAALTRRTWATAQSAPRLLLHLEWWRVYYHLVRPHQTLRVALPHPHDRRGRRLPQRYRARTPAMAAGVTTRPWTVLEVLQYPCVPAA